MAELTDKQRTPPKQAQENAKKVLRWREEHGDEVDAMEPTGWTRANQLAEGKPLSEDVISSMAQFNRHRGNSGLSEEFRGEPWKDNGYVAWLGWGGDAGVDWAIRTMDKIKGNINTQSQKFKANTSKIRTETFEGKEYLVAPVVAVQEQVLNGEFLSGDEISRYPQSWSGVPVTINHPKSGKNFVSANHSLEVLQEYKIGFLFNPNYKDDKKKLKAEIWLDIAKINELGGESLEALNKVKKGQPLDVSTGYFADTFDEVGYFNSVRYQGTQHNIRPDHLALLPNDIGACSWKDGCGVRANKKGGDNLNVNVLDVARTPNYQGTENVDWGGISKDFKDFREGYFAHSDDAPESMDDLPGTVENAPAAMKEWIAQKTLLGDADAESVEDLIVLPVVNPVTNMLNRGALEAVIRLAPQLEGVDDKTIQTAIGVARDLLMKEFDVEMENNQEQISKNKIKRLFSNFIDKFNFSNNKDITDNQMSYREKREELESLINQELTGRSEAYVKDFYDDYFIYEIWEEGKIFRRGYTGDESIELLDNAIEVEEIIEYKPIINQKEVQKLNREEIIKNVMDNECNKLKENTLKSMSDEELKFYANGLECNKEDGGDNLETNSKEKDQELVTINKDDLNKLTSRLEKLESSFAANEEKEKEPYIKTIVNSEKNPFEEDELKTFCLDRLKALSKAFAPVDYSGMGLPKGNGSKDDGEDYEAPSLNALKSDYKGDDK